MFALSVSNEYFRTEQFKISNVKPIIIGISYRNVDRKWLSPPGFEGFVPVSLKKVTLMIQVQVTLFVYEWS